MATISNMGVRLTKLANVFREIYRGSPEFPGRARFSRIATRLFGLRWIDRRDLAAAFRQAAAELSPPQQQRLQDALLRLGILVSKTRDQIKKGERQADPRYLEHYDYRKTLSPKKLAAICDALHEQAGLGETLFVVKERRFFVRPKIEAPVPEPSTVLESALIELLRSTSRPLTWSTLETELREKIKFSPGRLEAAKAKLYTDGILCSTHDGLVYLKAREQTFLAGGSLVVVQGLDQPLSLHGVEKFLRAKSIKRIFSAQGESYATAEYLRTSSTKFLTYYSSKGECLLVEEDLDFIQAHQRLLFGETETGEKVAIENTPALRKENRALLHAYELSKLRKAIQQAGLSEEAEKRITALADQQSSRQPTYLSLYRARKVLAMHGSLSLALAAIICDMRIDAIPRQIFENEKEAAAVIKAIRRCQEISAWVFDPAMPHRYYLDLIFRMQRQVAGDLNTVRLLLAYRISQAVYQTESVDRNGWEEMRFVCAPIAAQNGFESLADQFKDLRLMMLFPEGYLEAVKVFRNQTNMTRQQAKHFLEKTAAPYLKAKICEWTGLEEDEVQVYFRPKSYHSIYLKDRQVLDFLGVKAVIKCKGEALREMEEVDIILRLKPLLINDLITSQGGIVIETHKGKMGAMANVADNILIPRASGWRALKIYGRIEGRLVEVMVQSDEMYWAQKVADIAQVEWARDISREIKSQQFEKLPDNTATQLRTHLEHASVADINFRILRENDQGQVFVFIAGSADGTFLLTEKQAPSPRSASKLKFVPQVFNTVLVEGQRQTPTPEDVFCHSSLTAGRKLSTLRQVEVYRFATADNGKAVLVRKSFPKDKPYHVENGDVLLFRTQETAGVNLLHHLKALQKSALYFLTRFKAWQERWEADLAAYTKTKARAAAEANYEAAAAAAREEGKRRFNQTLAPLKQRLQTVRRRVLKTSDEEILKIVASYLGFSQPEDFLVILGQDPFEPKRISEIVSQVLDNTDYWYSLTELSAGRQWIEISLPEQKGILQQLYSQKVLERKGLLSLKTATKTIFGQIRTMIEFVLDSSQRKMDEALLTSALENLTQTTTVSASTTTQTLYSARAVPFTLGISTDSQGRWSGFKDLVDFIQTQKGVSIFEVNLPLSTEGEQALGRVRIKVHRSIVEKEEKLKALLDDLAILADSIEEG